MKPVNPHIARRVRELRSLLFIVGVLAAQRAGADVFPSEDVITDPAPDRFSVCYDYTCRTVSELSLPAENWLEIRMLFSPPAKDAADERKRIATAIGQMETVVGQLTGTSQDRGGTFPGLGRMGQMDCIDESVNTTIYLLMMSNDGLLRWHSVRDRATRGLLRLDWPHTTAVIEEIETGRSFTVDSWFHENGRTPVIIPLKEWRAGWKPEP